MSHKIVVQIYEIQEPGEAEVMISLGVDRIGSVLLSDQHWKVPAIREAILVSREAGVKHSLIPLLSDHQILVNAINYYQPDIIHFCESLTGDHGQMIDCSDFVELQKTMGERFPEIKLMRTVPVAVRGAETAMPTLEIARCFESTSHYFLTDTSLNNQPVDGYIGITGQAGDWQVTRDLVESSSIPVILAGGLSPENVYEAIMTVRPFGVDSCTGTNRVGLTGNSVRFKKDEDRVKAFVQEVRRAEKDLDHLQMPLQGRK